MAAAVRIIEDLNLPAAVPVREAAPAAAAAETGLPLLSVEIPAAVIRAAAEIKTAVETRAAAETRAVTAIRAAGLSPVPVRNLPAALTPRWAPGLSSVTMNRIIAAADKLHTIG